MYEGYNGCKRNNKTELSKAYARIDELEKLIANKDSAISTIERQGWEIHSIVKEGRYSYSMCIYNESVGFKYFCESSIPCILEIAAKWVGENQ